MRVMNVMIRQRIKTNPMQDITQCKECGHENPKNFMGKEYTSHAPNCSQDIKQQEEMNKRFDEKFTENGGVMPKHRDFGQTLRRDLLSFIQSEISLAVEQEKERVLDMVLKEIEYWKKHSSGNYADGAIQALDTLKERLKAKQ